jgi:uncharacterized surface protein with fasciclin (FAS1) repeats
MLTRVRCVIAGRALASAAVLVVAGCGTASNSAAHDSMHHAMHHPMHHTMPHPMAAPFGADCSMVPAAGMGSFHAMRAEPVLTAAAHNPLLTTFAAEAKKAGLTTRLNSAHGITVFAPENSAFAKLGHSAMMMLENPAELAQVLTYHVVAGHITTEQFTMAHGLRTLEGGVITPAKMGAVYEVNKADVICGGIATANATVYIINAVLVPMLRHTAS